MDSTNSRIVFIILGSVFPDSLINKGDFILRLCLYYFR